MSPRPRENDLHADRRLRRGTGDDRRETQHGGFRFIETARGQLQSRLLADAFLSPRTSRDRSNRRAHGRPRIILGGGQRAPIDK